MADVREVFPILQDLATGGGEGAISRTEGEAAAGQAGLIGFSFKDASGNVVLPQLNAAGAVPAYLPSPGTRKRADGTHAGSTSLQILADLTLTLTKVYENIGVTVSCFRDTTFLVEYVDDFGVTDTIDQLLAVRVGPGQYTFFAQDINERVNTTGGTGVQKLRIRGRNEFGVASTMDARVTAIELA